MTVHLILGTAGHIDHGKTSLVKALTGTQTDRLPEEKRRGITIDLGIAELDLGDFRLGIVDVPGHERFVRNMLAGATGVDLAMLVIAADDAVKPQTEEHLEILRLLGLSAGVIALSKCDLVDDDWIELVEEEIRSRVAGTFLADAPIIRTSVTTGQGLDQLKSALAQAAELAATSERRRLAAGPFRMAIDRAFSIAGHGAVVTGSVSSGQVRRGDELMIEPGHAKVRVRGLESHGRVVEQVGRGQRAAINLAGAHRDDFARGHELATPDHLVPATRLSVRLNLLDSAPGRLKNRARVKLHVGTAELVATVLLLDCDALTPGQSAPAQLLLAEAAVTTWGQPFVIRRESPVVTIGGGHVLDPDAPRLRRSKPGSEKRPWETWLPQLWSEDVVSRASAAVYFTGWRKWRVEDLARAAGADDVESVCRELVERGDLIEIAVSPTRTLRIHHVVFDDIRRRALSRLAALHDQFPLAAELERSRLTSRLTWLEDDTLVNAVLDSLASDGKIHVDSQSVSLLGRGPQLSPGEGELLERIVEIYREAEFHPPPVQAIKDGAEKNQASVPGLIELAASQGRIIRVAPQYYLHADAEQRMRDTLRERMSADGMTVSQIREALGTTRKYAVPLCEYLDRIRFTRRQGDVRMLR